MRQALSKVFADKLNLALEALGKIESAKFWIENRESTGIALGVYGITLSGATLGLPEDKNFVYPWIYKTTTKKKNDAGEWVVDKVDEKPTEDICYPIKFKKGFHDKAIDAWYSYNFKLKRIQVYFKKPEIIEDTDSFFGTFREFVGSANKSTGWSALPISLVVMRVDEWGAYKLDVVMEP